MKEKLVRALSALGPARVALAELGRERQVFLVGGAIRDVVIDRTPKDFDFAVSGSGVEFARKLARRLKAKLVVLSAEDDEARVVWQGLTLDVNGFGEGSIQEDLARRDFTVNALACELLGDKLSDAILDPAGGLKDINERRIRPVSPRSLALDPLRLLRAYRLALELDMKVEPEVETQAQRVSLGGIAPERLGAEMLRIMEASRSFWAMQRLLELGKLREILPEFEPVLADEKLCEHSFATYFKLEELIRDGSFFSRYEPEWYAYFECWGVSRRTGQKPREGIGTAEEGEVVKGLPFRRAMLKLCGLLHDISKPETRFVNAEGEVHFYGHDTLGSRVAARMVRDRLRLSRAAVRMVETQVREHMRLHLLATNPELTERAIRRFFRDLGEEAFGLMMLCYADGWATAGQTSHLEDTIDRMIKQKRAEDAKLRVQRYVTGHDLIALGLTPGPVFKVILQELEDLQLEGKINSHEEGIEYLKLHLPGLSAKDKQNTKNG